VSWCCAEGRRGPSAGRAARADAAPSQENAAREARADSAQRLAGLLRSAYYGEHPNATAPRLYVIDDGSQRNTGDRRADDFAAAMAAALDRLGLARYVSMQTALNLGAAHALFEPDSLGMVWNDAQWDPDFIRDWWPLLKKDGGLLLLHNVVGNGELSRWCIASPRRVLKALFPGEKFEFMTLVEPHKAYQGSVALLRRLDPAKKPAKFRFLWGGKDQADVALFTDWGQALDRPGLNKPI